MDRVARSQALNLVAAAMEEFPQPLCLGRMADQVVAVVVMPLATLAALATCRRTRQAKAITEETAKGQARSVAVVVVVRVRLALHREAAQEAARRMAAQAQAAALRAAQSIMQVAEAVVQVRR